MTLAKCAKCGTLPNGVKCAKYYDALEKMSERNVRRVVCKKCNAEQARLKEASDGKV